MDLLSSGWCFTKADSPYASHSIGDLQFGPDGALYVSAGDGANYDTADVGNFAIDNCPDPVNEGGALRSQDLRTSADPTNYDGAILRIDPLTGLAVPGNPYYGSVDQQKSRIIAYGLRNPFRFAIDPTNGALWVPDNGWSLWLSLIHI